MRINYRITTRNVCVTQYLETSEDANRFARCVPVATLVNAALYLSLSLDVIAAKLIKRNPSNLGKMTVRDDVPACIPRARLLAQVIKKIL